MLFVFDRAFTFVAQPAQQKARVEQEIESCGFVARRAVVVNALRSKVPQVSKHLILITACIGCENATEGWEGRRTCDDEGRVVA
jgi:hypothetical protein